MRGKVLVGVVLPQCDRITPAYAGKSRTHTAVSSAYKDHPRLCGEKLLPALHTTSMLGSPPPMRGKVDVEFKSGESRGITPAYAGKRLAVDL